MHKQNGIFIPRDQDQNKYATNFGNNLASYTNKALYITNGGSLANTNNHNNFTQNEDQSVVFNNTNNIINQNNYLFSQADKSIGDDLVFIAPLAYEAIPIIGGLVAGIYSKYWLNKDIDKVNDAISSITNNNSSIMGEIKKNSPNLAVSKDKKVKNGNTGESGYVQDDGSIMVKDRGSKHGGSEWKRYTNKNNGKKETPKEKEHMIKMEKD